MAEMSPLRRRMIEDMTIRNLSPATQQSYLYAVSKFSRHFGHSPDRLGVEDVRAYPVHLTSKGFAWSSLNQTVCALRFFYGVTLGSDDDRRSDSLRPRAAQASHRAGRGGSGAVSGSRFQPEGARGADDGLCRRSAGLRSRRAQDQRHRQPPHGAADRTRQGRQGALRHALRARCSASCASIGDWRGRGRSCFPVGRPHADRAERAACRLPIGERRGGTSTSM